jgi:hypothetical protein
MIKFVRLFLVSVLLLGMALWFCEYSYADLKEGLVAGWTFDDGTARDQTRKGHDGEKKGNPKSVKGKFGMGYDFNGADTGVEIDDHKDLQLTEPFTVAAWIFPRVCKDHAGIVWKGTKIGWGTNVYNYRIAELSTTGLTWGACTGAVEGYFGTAGILNEMNEWYHVALVEDGVKGIAYVNGKSGIPTTEGDANRPVPPYDPLAGSPVRIGWAIGYQGVLPGEVYFDGIIDEVFIYNRPLSADEIKELMEKGPGLAVESAGKLATTWSYIRAD